MKKEKLCFADGKVPAVLYGEKTSDAFLFIHGKFGNKEEGEAFATLAVREGYQVLALDLPEHGERTSSDDKLLPWVVVPELREAAAFLALRGQSVSLRANSIGAWFALLAFAADSGVKLEKSLFVSPILDMTRLISDMLTSSGANPEKLRAEGEIITPSGETISYEYYDYALRNKNLSLSGEVFILCPENDSLTPREVTRDFCDRNNSAMTYAAGCEHWFHTPEQLEILRRWTLSSLRSQKLTMVIEQTKDYKMRTRYLPDSKSFIETESVSLAYLRGFTRPYGWIKESGTPPAPHFDVILMSDSDFSLGDELPIRLIGIFMRRDGDNKFIAVEKDRPVYDISELTPEETDALHRLYPRVGEGEGWFGYYTAVKAFAESDKAL